SSRRHTRFSRDWSSDVCSSDLVSGNLDLTELEALPPLDFYERITKIRGIGPTTAQDLTHFRERTDGIFPSRIEKGQEHGLRRWRIGRASCRERVDVPA